MGSRVRLYDGEKVIGYVAYTSNLDHWDGNNWSDGSTGRHLGLGKTKDGRYYLCYGTQWQGESDNAEIISLEGAKEAALKNDPEVYEEFFGEVPDLTAVE